MRGAMRACAQDPSASGLAVLSISGLFTVLSGVCMNQQVNAQSVMSGPIQVPWQVPNLCKACFLYF